MWFLFQVFASEPAGFYLQPLLKIIRLELKEIDVSAVRNAVYEKWVLCNCWGRHKQLLMAIAKSRRSIPYVTDAVIRSNV